MNNVLEQLINLLRLEQIETDTFLGQVEDLGFNQLFGGQLLAQSLMAASLTADGFKCHSLHGHFLQPGDVTNPVQFKVDRILEGNSFKKRRVTAVQNGVEIFTANVSFHVDENGHEHQYLMPEVTPPEELHPELEIRRKFANMIPEKYREKFTPGRPDRGKAGQTI